MDPFYILAIFISSLIFIILPLACIGLLFLLLKRKANQKLAVVISTVLLTALGYFIITDSFPTEAFYVSNFEENTGLTFPGSAKLVSRSGNSSIWNFGDYNISYAYELPGDDYRNLFSQLVAKGFKTTETYLETSQNDKLLNMYPTTKVDQILTRDFGFKNFDVLFLEDNKTIIFNSNKW